jgi:hypothetical protein
MCRDHTPVPSSSAPALLTVLSVILALIAPASGDQPNWQDPLWNTAPPSSFAWYHNGTHGGTWSFPGNLPDPTIMKLTDASGLVWFYVTGTTDDLSTLNFVIYRSLDLHSWCYVGTAFQHNVSNGALVLSSGRKFRGLWSPHLYVDPHEDDLGMGRNIYLSFSATEVYDQPPIPNYDLSDNRTVMVTTVSKQWFLVGGKFADPNHPGGSRANEPIWYYYRVQNSGDAYYDGGWQQGQYEHVSRTVPVTLNPWLEGAMPGNPYRVQASPGVFTYGWGHASVGTNTIMADAPFVFFEPLNRGGKGWILYNWNRVANDQFDANNVAAYPLYDNFTTEGDVAWTSRHAPIGYRYNVSLQPFYGSSLPNGGVDNDGVQWHNCYHPACPASGVAEGGSVFYNVKNNRYYVFYNRNPVGHAYQLVYRVGEPGQILWDLRLKDGAGSTYWTNQTVSEHVLVAGNWVLKSDGMSRDPNDSAHFGGGEVTFAWGRPYLVFHGYDPVSQFRKVYFKELTLDAGGVFFKRLFDGHPSLDQDLNYFWAPNSPACD